MTRLDQRPKSSFLAKSLSIVVALLIGAGIYLAAWRATRPAPPPLPAAFFGTWEVISAKNEQGIERGDIRYRIEYRDDGAFNVAPPDRPGMLFGGYVIPASGIRGQWTATWSGSWYHVAYRDMQPAGDSQQESPAPQTVESSANVTIRPGGQGMECQADDCLMDLTRMNP